MTARNCLSFHDPLFILLAFGGKVIAAAGSQEKLEIARRYGGADYVVDYSKPDWQKDVLKITNGGTCPSSSLHLLECSISNAKVGVDIVFDPVGLVQCKSSTNASIQSS